MISNKTMRISKRSLATTPQSKSYFNLYVYALMQKWVRVSTARSLMTTKHRQTSLQVYGNLHKHYTYLYSWRKRFFEQATSMISRPPRGLAASRSSPDLYNGSSPIVSRLDVQTSRLCRHRVFANSRLLMYFANSDRARE